MNRNHGLEIRSIRNGAARRALACMLGLGLILSCVGVSRADDTQFAQILFKDGKLIDERKMEIPPAPPPLAPTPSAELPEPGAKEEAAIMASIPAGLSIGYVPMLTSAPLHLMQGLRLDRKYGFVVFPRRMRSEQSMVEAVAAGKLNGAYADIGLAILAFAQGAPISIIAANAINATPLIARGKLAMIANKMRDSVPGEGAVRIFTTETKEKLILLTPERNTLANLAIEDWLVRVTGLAAQDSQVKGVSPGRMWRLLQGKTIDGAITSEPMLSALRKVSPEALVVVGAREILPGMPANVLIVHRSLIREHRKEALNLLRAHRESVNTLAANPRGSAPYVYPAVSWARLSTAEIAAALASEHISFAHNPIDIAAASLVAHNLLVEQGKLRHKASLNELINTTLYTEISETSQVFPQPKNPAR